MSLKRGLSPAPSPALSQHVFTSAPLADRQSVFVAHFSPTLSAKALQAHPDFKSATHRIAAWRKPSAQRSILASDQRVLEAGHDDDGEKYAGKRLERLLDALAIEGAIVVARWYGGSFLGPVRFEHIENCAKQAIRDWRAAVAEAGRAEAQKRQRVNEDARPKEELERVLAERDRSVDVLRRLLADKTAAFSSHASAETGPETPRKQMNYTAIPVQALRKLEKARDATIAFLLKEIDKVEEQILKDIEDADDERESSTTAAAGPPTEDQKASSPAKASAGTSPAHTGASSVAQKQNESAKDDGTNPSTSNIDTG